MFVRTKKIKKYSYAYLVENSWKKNSSRQRVKQYLGRVHDFADTPLRGSFSFEDVSFSECVTQLAISQIESCGFTSTVLDSKTVYEKDNLVFDPTSLSFYHKKTKKPYVIKSYDGYLCSHTLQELSNFKANGEDEEQMGYDLAKAFIAAGFNMPKDLFVELFVKIRPVKVATTTYDQHPK